MQRRLLGDSRNLLLKRARDGGRVVFGRAQVEASAYAREVAKAQRVQEAEQRELRDDQASLHHEAVEFDAWSKSLGWLFEFGSRVTARTGAGLRAGLVRTRERNAAAQFGLPAFWGWPFVTASGTMSLGARPSGGRGRVTSSGS